MQWQFKLIYSEGNHFCRGNGRTKKKAGGGLAAGGTGRDGAMGGAVTGLRAISNFTYEMVEIVEENRKDAVLGSIGQDVRCSRLGRFDNFYPFH